MTLLPDTALKLPLRADFSGIWDAAGRLIAVCGSGQNFAWAECQAIAAALAEAANRTEGEDLGAYHRRIGHGAGAGARVTHRHRRNVPRRRFRCLRTPRSKRNLLQRDRERCHGLGHAASGLGTRQREAVSRKPHADMERNVLDCVTVLGRIRLRRPIPSAQIGLCELP